jgi:integrase
MAGSIRKRGERRWLVRVALGADPRTGKRLTLAKTIHGTRADAQKWLNDALLRKDMGDLIQSSSMRLSELLDRWLVLAVKPRTREITWIRYKGQIEMNVIPKLGNIPLKNVRAIDIQQHLADLSRRLRPATVRLIHTLLVNAFKQALRWQLLRQNPMTFVDSPRNEPREMKAMTAAQAKEFLEAAKDDDFKTFFLFALLTGCRPGEIFALKWGDIDFASGIVTIQRNLVRRNNTTWYFSEPKSPRSRRSLKLTPRLVASLQDLRRRQAEVRMRNRKSWEDLDLVFTDSFGACVSIDRVRRRFKKLVKAAGLDRRLRLYDLRHSCASILTAQGCNPKIVSERLGHSTVKLTLDLYTHLAPGLQTQAGESLEKAIFS